MAPGTLDPTLPCVVLLVDNSESMSRHGRAVETAIADMKRELDGKCNIGIARFSSQYKGLTFNQHSDYVYRGDTALYSSMVNVLQDLSQTYGLTSRNKVMVAVITDGMDNNSSYNASQVKAEVTVAENLLHWDFLYIGTNQAANEVGQMCGVKLGKALSFAPTDVGFDRMLEVLKDIARKWLGGALAHNDQFFTEETQQEQVRLGARI